MFEKRNKWIKTRFGNIDEKILGRIEEVKEISFGNSELEWHHNPQKIIEMFWTGDWNFYGGSDNRYFRQNMIYYGKLYGDGLKHRQKWETMELTEKAGTLIKTVKELWADVI